MSKSEQLSFVLPNGSLSEPLLGFLATAGYVVPKPDRRGFCGIVNGIEFYQFDRRMVSAFVAGMNGLDAGLTGKDLVLASRRTVREVSSLCFSRSSYQPTRWVLAQRSGEKFDQYSNVCIGCELPDLAEKLLVDRSLPFRYQIEKIEGSEEACVRYGIVDMVLVVTETGTSIAANGLEIVAGCECLLQSTPVIIAQEYLPQSKEEQLQALRMALEAVCAPKDTITVSFDIPCTVDVATLQLPSAIAPSLQRLTDAAWNAGEICCKRSELGAVLLRLRASGAKAIVIRDIQGYLP